jgi:hypothetical protein
MRRLIGVGTPRSLQGRLAALITVFARVSVISRQLFARWGVTRAGGRLRAGREPWVFSSLGRLTIGTCATGCTFSDGTGQFAGFNARVDVFLSGYCGNDWL